MNKQLYGWTGPFTTEGPYVQYIAASETDDGSIEITIRNAKGDHNQIVLAPEDATELALKIMLSGKCREIAHAKIPQPVDEEGSPR